MIQDIYTIISKIELTILSCNSIEQCNSARNLINNFRNTYQQLLDIDAVDGIAVALIELLKIQINKLTNNN